MLDNFKPTWLVTTIFNITPEQLTGLGIKAVLTDLDNTLVEWNNPDAKEITMKWIKQFKTAGIPIVVVSNNSDKRIKRVADNLGVNYVARAKKPMTSGITRALSQLKLSENEVVMIGDQLITDIWAGNRANVRTILVEPLVDTDSWKTRTNRFLERHLLYRYLNRKKLLKWRDSLDDTDA